MSDDSAVAVRAFFHLCKTHSQGFYIENHHVQEETFNQWKDPMCDVAGCKKPGYTAQVVMIQGYQS